MRSKSPQVNPIEKFVLLKATRFKSPKMAARRLITSLLLLFLYVHSVAVTPGFYDLLDSIEELLDDTERLMNANNSTVVDSVVGRLQCAVDTYILLFSFFYEWTTMQPQGIYPRSTRKCKLIFSDSDFSIECE